MPESTFPTIKTNADSPTLVRKILEAVAFLGPEDAADFTALTGATSMINTLPTGYWPVGLVTPDGYTFGGDTNTESVEALGYTAPVRTDIVSATRTVAFTALETYRMNLMSLVTGMDLATVVQSATGEIKFDRPARPSKQYFRLIVVGRDGSGATEWLRGKFFPRVSISEFPEEVWSAADPSQYPITLDTYVDDVIGTGERDFIAGKGALAAKTILGWTQP